MRQDAARFKVIITEEYEQADYSKSQLTMMNKAADRMAGLAPAKPGRRMKVEKISKGRIIMSGGDVFVKSSPASTPKRRRLQKGGVDVAAVREHSREEAGIIMGVTADGMPMGLSVQQDPESDDDELVLE